MFTLPSLLRPITPVRSPARAPALRRRCLPTGAILRLAFLTVPLAAALPAGASAQALGTMQVTARVLPGRPSWTAVSVARILAEQLHLSPSSSPTVRRAGLVHARADLVPVAGSRRLRITVDYPRN